MILVKTWKFLCVSKQCATTNNLLNTQKMREENQKKKLNWNFAYKQNLMWLILSKYFQH